LSLQDIWMDRPGDSRILPLTNIILRKKSLYNTRSTQKAT